MGKSANRFSLKAYNRWEVQIYKGKLRVVMNRDPMAVRQKIRGLDVLSPSRVRDLCAWLNRYLAEVSPTNESVAIAGIRANTRGIQRELLKIESAPPTHDEAQV